MGENQSSEKVPDYKISEMENQNPKVEGNLEVASDGTNNTKTLPGDSDDVEANLRKRQVFYELSADATIHFKNGETLRVNKAMLAFQSDIFVKEFFGSPSKNHVNIDDFDRETFQTFLDCLIGLKKYSVIDALLIFPIAHKFQVAESLKKCINVLKPTEMNENVLLTLNLALFYDCNEIIDDTINFLKAEVNITKLIEDQNFNKSLEPAAMLKLIENVQLDSYLWMKIYEWGEKYLKIHSKDQNVRKFFNENKIFAKFLLTDFESFKSIFDFHEIVTKKNFLNDEELLTHFKIDLLNNENDFTKKSEWVFVKEGETIEEKIIFKHPLSFAYSATPFSSLTLEIWRNEVVCYPQEKYFEAINYNVSYKFKDCQADSARYSKDPDQSQDFSSEETTINDKSKKMFICIDIRRPSYLLEISSIDCTYKFFCDCRILKKSLNQSLCVSDSKNLYFTQNVIV